MGNSVEQEEEHCHQGKGRKGQLNEHVQREMTEPEEFEINSTGSSWSRKMWRVAAGLSRLSRSARADTDRMSRRKCLMGNREWDRTHKGPVDRTCSGF